MAWPSGTKASTTNVDAGTDSITSARTDIKQNIDNVNDIIDHLNISSPTDGDVLKYSSSSGKWEQVASTSVGSNTKFAVFNRASTGTDELVSGTTYRAGINVHLDPDGIMGGMDSAGGNTFDLSAGSYIIMSLGILADSDTASFKLHNDTDDSEILVGGFDEVHNVDDALLEFNSPTFTLAGTKTCSWRQTYSGLTLGGFAGAMMFIKI